jgi:hypothetical protein
MQKQYSLKLSEAYDILHEVVEHALRLQAAAESNEKSVNTATANLSALISEIPHSVAGKIGEMLAAEPEKLAKELNKVLTKVNEQADNACRRYERAARWSIVRLGIIVFACFVGGVFVIKQSFVPTLREIQELRSEKARLEEVISRLEGRGAKANLAVCGVQHRPCVRIVDEKNNDYGNDKTEKYRIIFGY